jgi:hypothetical protein
MSQEKLVITIRPDGSVHYQTEGFTGQACLNATQSLSSLGPTINEGRTAEFYRPQKVKDPLKSRS